VTVAARGVAQRELVDERTLIAGVMAGDRAAGRALYDAHAPRVYRLAYRLTGDDDLAQDLTQETFIRAFGRLGDFRGDSAFGTWLHTIAMSVTLNGLKRAQRHRGRTADLAAADALPSGGGRRADPDLRQRLAQAIDALPEIYRVVFVMHDVEGYTHDEIGAALGVPAGTARARLSYARARLRTALADFAKDGTT
jgi:RNA polymerase sigma-70 factor (ECF subfamily)